MNTIKNNITEAIGNTPLVRLSNLSRSLDINCELLVKCKFMNPGASIKDRIVRRMI